MMRFDITPSPDTVQGDDVLTGDVVVEVDTTTQCPRLDLALQCITRLDTRQVHVLSQGRLFEGTWQPGETYRYPFEVRVPNGPFSVQQGPWQIVWRLHAEADLPHMAEPWTCAHPFTLVPTSPPAALAYNPGTLHPVTQWRPETTPSWVTRELSWVLALFGGLSVGLELRSGQDRFPYIGFLILALAMSLVIAGRRERRRQLQDTLPLDITLTLDPPDPGPGESLDVEVSWQSLAPLQLDHMTLSLHAMAREGDIEHTLHQTTTTLMDSPQTFDIDETSTSTATLDVPARAVHAFEVGPHAVRWYVELAIDVEGRSTWQRRVPCVVAPPPPESSS